MKLCIFTDLDGTLLDHTSYAYTPASPALEKLKQHNIPLVLASSKTAAELTTIRESLSMTHWPCIVENGGGVLEANLQSNRASDQNSTCQSNDYDTIRKAVVVSTHAKLYRGFGDMTVAEVAAVTGLSTSAASLAKQRLFTEPGVFNGCKQQQAEFLAELKQHNISARDGGRFLTLSFGHTKADRLHEIASKQCADVTIALGDAPNDREMLLAVDYPVIIRNDYAPDMGVIPGAMKTDEPGPVGWNDAVLTLLDKLLGI